MADQAQELSSPISLKTLRSELQSYRKAVASDIKTQMESLHQEIKRDILSVREETKTDIRTLREELFADLATLHTAQAEFANDRAEMEKSLNDTMDRVAALENSRETLAKECKKIHEKCTDLENRSRRQNLRFIGIMEGVEAGNPTRFVTELLSELFGVDSLGDSPIIIDRAHRSLAPKPKPGERPRPMIVCFHYYSDKEKILRLSRNKGRLHYNGTPLHIFPDMSPEVSKLRAAFNPVKAKLRDAGVSYSLYYPAKLAITVDGSRYTFDNPQDAEKFVERKILNSIDGNKE